LGREAWLSNSDDAKASQTVADAPVRHEPNPSRLENVELAAKIFVPATEAQIDCVVSDLSAEGATIRTKEGASMGSEIALYIEGFDRFSAFLVEASRDRVRVKFNCSPLKQARTAEKIRRYLSGKSAPATISPAAPGSALHSVREFTRSNGQTVTFDVIDISLSGASLRTSSRPPIGEVVTIGTVEGRIARHFDDGIAVEFFRRASPVSGAAG
jgi:hypothetical protein